MLPYLALTSPRPRRLSAERAVSHIDALVRLAHALCGSRHEAEDVVQDVYLRVLSRPRFMLGDELAYLSRCVRNEVRTRWRRTRRQPRTVAMPDEEALGAAADAAPQERVEAREVVAAIAELPDAYRDAVALVDVAGLSYQEAADVLEVPVGTIMSRLYRGRTRIVRAIGGETEYPAASRVLLGNAA
jgi:RNA polymerase sigma-70 factor (ECF subfamily)